MDYIIECSFRDQTVLFWRYIRVFPVCLSPGGLTRLSLSPVRLNSGTWHRRACPVAEGTQTHGGSRLVLFKLYFSWLIKTSASHSSLISSLFLHPPYRRTEFGYRQGGKEAEDQRAALRWSTRAPGAQGARRTRSEWRWWMGAAPR